MKIISHRGYWHVGNEKNTMAAFERSFSMGFGTETDIRDYNGDLVISHDVPSKNSLPLAEFLNIYSQYDNKLQLALNIKADGLQSLLKKYIDKYSLSEYFVFDMSIPDLLGYVELKLNPYYRISEYEVESTLTPLSSGIWLDGFNSSLIDENRIEKYLNDGLSVCIVSPELHGLEYMGIWSKIKGFDQSILTSNKLTLCTDIPERALEMFYE
ncbi:hypothetical protein OP861_14130 [Yersinia intermedia]|uniref:hypothetical protein n=1 Tax=Yersinia intermedia TaxID=631 RepID=UPI00223FDE76|nr:hypothetical protein [Yersinia intermedia]UZM69717.1 hypothetical protein OP861_14130 [Yersinia intermedia]